MESGHTGAERMSEDDGGMIMNWRVLTVAAALLPVIGGISQLSAQEIGDVANGRIVATTICAACHMVGKGELQSPAGGAPTFARVAGTPGMTSIALSALLLTSHRQMPNIILPPDERRDVIAYILSLQ
jgi:mono/diheme cytochrome c family protein